MYKISRADERHRKDINRLCRKYIWSELDKSEPVRNYWIIRHRGKVIACAAMDNFRGSAIFTSLVVEREFRHRGIGSLLIEHRLNRARQKGAKYVALITMYYHFRFYKKRGFRTCPRTELPESLKGYPQFTAKRYMKCAVMFREL